MSKDDFKKARDAELENCKEMYFAGELGSDYKEGSLHMANWTYNWCQENDNPQYEISRAFCDAINNNLTKDINIYNEAEVLAEALERYEHMAAPTSKGYHYFYASQALTRWREFKDKGEQEEWCSHGNGD